MQAASPKTLMARLSGSGLIVLVVLLGIAFLAVVLVPGLHLAGQLADNTVELKRVGQQQRNPTLIRASLDGMHDRLASHGYIQESLDQLRDATTRMDAAFSNPGSPMAGKHAPQLQLLWMHQRQMLTPVLEFKGVPYQDSEASGTQLNERGRELERDVNAAIKSSKRTMPAIDAELSAIINELQAANERSASQLRLVMLTGLLIAVVLVALVTMLLLARKRQDLVLKEARQQTADILRTVKDGLFLLNRDLIIGASYSSALESLFGRNHFAGVHFEALLKEIVSEKTLATALKFVGVLWAERTKENLVKSINPLGEVEINVDDGRGRTVTRHLQFDFHRVRVEGKITQVLVCVSDVSARVGLARELQESQAQAQGQVDTLLGILHVDPAQLSSFLGDSSAAMKMINAVLREPAREEGAFRKKLDTLFRQVHSVKGEAAALGMSSIESRAHSFEDDLKNLRDKADLSGNDFLPLVIKLDDLLTHLQSVGDLVSRLSRLQLSAPHTETAVIEEASVDLAKAKTAGGVVAMLQQLAERVAAENDKEAKVQCMGFDTIPNEYRRIVKDIGVQAVRNAVVHGIEARAERLAHGKPAQGALRLSFQDLGAAGYKLVAEDDGQGLSTEKIKEAALKKGFIDADKAQTLETKQVFSLLFQSGFSTLDAATKDAGRGVGMNLVAGLMHQVGGKVSVATMPGKFTRFTMSFPPAKRADDTEAA